MVLYLQCSAEYPTYYRSLMKDIFYFLKMKTNILLTVKLSINDFALPHSHPHTYTKSKTVLFLLKFHCYFNLLIITLVNSRPW